MNPKHTKTLLNKGIVLAFGKEDLKAAAVEWQKVVDLAPGPAPKGEAARRALEGVAAAPSSTRPPRPPPRRDTRPPHLRPAVRRGVGVLAVRGRRHRHVRRPPQEPAAGGRRP